MSSHRSVSDLGALLKGTHKLLMERLAEGVRARAKVDLAPSVLTVFGMLDTDGETALGPLSATLGITKQSAGQMIKDLEIRGYVEVSRDPKDARQRVVTVTEKGRTLADDLRALRVEMDRAVAASLGDNELEEIDTGLRRLRDALSTE